MDEGNHRLSVEFRPKDLEDKGKERAKRNYREEEKTEGKGS